MQPTFINARLLRALIGVAALGAAMALPTLPAQAANVSISVHQPGVYGRITLGGPVPSTAWVAPQPVRDGDGVRNSRDYRPNNRYVR